MDTLETNQESVNNTSASFQCDVLQLKVEFHLLAYLTGD